MKKIILISLMTLLISQQPVVCGEQDNGGDIERLLSNPKASTFQMTWHGGGAGKLEIAVEPGCLRVHEVRMLETPPPEAIDLGGIGAQYGRIEFADFGQTKFMCGLKKSSEEVEDPDVFFIDLNHNGHLESTEIFKGAPATYPPLDKIHYGAMDITLHDRDQERVHRVFAWHGKFDDLYIVSHCYMQGRIRIGSREVTAVLVDYNCDGRYASGRTSPESIGTLGPREIDYDQIGWDADGDGKIEWSEQHFIGSYLVCDGDVFQVGCSPDGRTLTVVPVEVPMGHLQMPTQNAFVRLVGDVGPMNLRITDGTIAVPAGTYQVDYLYIEETGDHEEVTRLSKSGQYFDKPWKIRAGVTTKINREKCIITEKDRRNYEARMRELRGEGPQPRIASLLGEPLGKLDEFNVALDPAKLKGKRILICFWDMSQRPSRWCVGELARRKEELIQKGIVTIGIHTSQVDQARLDNWLSENEVDFPVGMIKDTPQQILQSWGVQARPWLILTDRDHVVIAEGFGLSELDAKIEEVEPSENAPAESNKTTVLPKIPQGQPLSGMPEKKDGTGPVVKLSDASTNRADPQERTVMGRVVDPNGQPLAQIPIVTYGYHKREAVTENDGRFTFKLPLDYYHEAGCLIVARDRRRNLAAFHSYVGQDSYILMKLEPAVVLAGTICDSQANGIPKAHLVFYWRFPGAGVYYGKSEYVAFDKKGRFEIRAIPYGRRYSVDVYAQGYGRASASINTDGRDARIQLPPLVLRSADQSVGGIVVDPNGNPIVDAKVYAGGEGQPGCQSQSNKQGHFLIKGVCPGTVTLRGEHTHAQLLISGDIEVQAGDMDVSLVLNERRLQALSKPNFESLMGKALPSITDICAAEEQSDTANKQILICYFDMTQRPSRRCVIQLAKQAQQLRQKGVAVIAVQTSKTDESTLGKWVKKNGIPFPVEMVRNDEQQIRSTWGVKALPWLILTDREHVVIAEGFGLGELNAKIEEIGPSASAPVDSHEVTGLVTDPNGQVLSGVRVTEFQTDKEYTTDDDGTFVSVFEPSSEQRFFFAVDKQRQLVGNGSLPPGERQVEIKLVPAKIVSGTVVDPDGKPVAGAQVAPLPMTCFHVLTDKQGQFDVAWSSSWEPREGLCLMVRHVALNLAALVDITNDTETIKVKLTAALTLWPELSKIRTVNLFRERKPVSVL